MPSPLRTPLRLVVTAAFALAALALFPDLARAQTVTIPNTPASLGRVDANGAGVTLRGQANYPYGVSLSDCVADQSITFPINLAGFNANMALEVWATSGTYDCSDDSQRGAQTGSQTCWKVANNPPLTTSQTVAVKVRDIIASPATKSGSYVAQDATICGKIALTTFKVYFILTQGGAKQNAAEQDITANTIGPAAVSNVAVSQGDTRLHVTWTAVGTTTDEGGTTTGTSATTAMQVAVYWQAAGSGGSNVDGGTTLVCADASVVDAGVDDAGVAQTTTADGGCYLQPIQASASACYAPGFLSTGPDGTVSSETVSASSSEATIGGLANGTTYAVAVAAQDAFLNAGTISSLVCQSPIKLNDFFETYVADGGQAGGACSLDMIGAPAGGASLAVIAFSLMLAVARRRSERKDDAGENATEGQDKE